MKLYTSKQTVLQNPQMRNLLLICVLIFNIFHQLNAQKTIYLNYKLDTDTLFNVKKFNDSLSVKYFLDNKIETIAEKGHLEASLDSLKYTNDSLCNAYMHLGPVYQWTKLHWKITDPIFQKASSWDSKYEKKPISLNKLNKQKKRLLNQATERGYPFASIYLEKIKIDTNEIEADLKAEKGPFITMDDITVEGEKIVSEPKLWYNLLDIKKGKPFTAGKITQIDQRINELPFAGTSAPTQIIFKDDMASLRLYLKKKKSNHFDVILGLQPTAGSDPTQTRTILTGQITADVYNMLSAGERIFIDYRRFDKEDQNIQLGLTWPYILGSKIGGDGQFILQKRDTTNLDIQYNIGAKIPLKNRSSVKIFLQNNLSNILSVNKIQILNSGKLPSILDYRRSSFGLEAAWTSLDYILNPSGGWDIKIKTLAGLRSIKKNQKILDLSTPEIDFNAQYDSLNKKTEQFRLDFVIEKYIQIFNRQVIKTSVNSGNIFSTQKPLRNELYRIGGYRLLRGFDEQSLEVSQYMVGTLEYRYILGPLSYVFLFSDVAYIKSQFSDVNYTDSPISLGLGLTLETKAGLFGIVAAVGQRKSLPFDFRSPKIHFGYVSVF